MATTNGESSQPVLFTTQTAYPLPTQKFMIPATWKRYQLSQLINKALSLTSPVPFDFLVKGEILRSSLAEWCQEKGLGEEETIEIEYIESVLPPQKVSSISQDDWVSGVSCAFPGHFITSSYDGHIRLFDYSQNLVHAASVHAAPITAISLVPTPFEVDESLLIASASHDMTGRIIKLSVTESGYTSQPIASLHLHTSPLSSISSNSSGSNLLTSSWDNLIGLWDTSIPEVDEVDVEIVDRKKRRKLGGDSDKQPKRKAPISVLKSHTARVSKAVFSSDGKSAYSCGYDSTIRTWDVENGICTNTLTASEKPMLDMVITHDDNTAIVSSTDRMVSVYDLRTAQSNIKASSISLAHSSTPSTIALSPTSTTQIITGAYDGSVRLWDLRSVKSAIATFKVWDGEKKVLSVDVAKTGGVVGVGGEGGLEVWKV